MAALIALTVLGVASVAALVFAFILIGHQQHVIDRQQTGLLARICDVEHDDHVIDRQIVAAGRLRVTVPPVAHCPPGH